MISFQYMDPRHIEYIIDLDGFYTQDDQFHPKKLGIFHTRTRKTSLFRFLLPTTFDQLSPADRRTAAHVTKRIHGIHYSNDENDLPISTLISIMDSIIQDSNENRTYIGYKGGNYERDLLNMHGATYICDISQFGVPKFDEPFQNDPYAYHSSNIFLVSFPYNLYYMPPSSQQAKKTPSLPGH